MQATILDLEDVTTDLCVVYLRPEKSFSYKAGQYLNLTVNGYEPRPYSIANAPRDDGQIELHIRRGGQISTYICDQVQCGDIVEIEGAFGQCTYKAQCKKPIIALAGGTGLAQVKALVEKALSTNRENPVYLYHGAKEQTDLYLDTVLRQLSKQDPRLIYRPVISSQMKEDDPLKYVFIGDHIAQDFDDLKNFRSYMCGNPEMIGALNKILLAKGIDANRIHSDV